MMKFSTVNIGNDKLCCVRNNQLCPAYAFASVTQPFIVNIIIYENILSPKVFFFFFFFFLLLDVTSCELCHDKNFLWDLQRNWR